MKVVLALLLTVMITADLVYGGGSSYPSEMCKLIQKSV
jgi:hypothetical protein